jgi:3-oxoacyl-[acyl-carrier protein] reductase
MQLNLKGKRALITGASRGIGLAIKKALEKEGVEVISWSRSEGQDLEKEIPEVPDVDIIINNVGGGGHSNQWDLDYKINKNLGIMVDIICEWTLYNKPWGRIITIASIYGANPGMNAGFAAAKAAQIMFMKSLALQNRYPGITFNCVSPAEVSDAGVVKDVKLKANDVANLVTFLCSDKAKMITGQNIIVGEYNNA